MNLCFKIRFLCKFSKFGRIALGERVLGQCYSDSDEAIEMAFDKYGKPPLLVLHCLFGSKSNWITLSRALNATLNRTVYALDLRNHGDSPHSEVFNFLVIAEDVKRFLDSLQISKVSIMGHSTGGKAALYYGLKYPESIEKIISIDMSPFSASGERNYMYKFFRAMKSVKVDDSLSISDGRKMARQQLKKYVTSHTVIDFLLMNLIKTDQGQFKWRLNINSLEENFYENITVFPQVSEKSEKPVLFIVGIKSDYVRRSDEKKILEMFPKSQFVYLNTSHWVHAQDPEGVINAVTDFLKY